METIDKHHQCTTRQTAGVLLTPTVIKATHCHHQNLKRPNIASKWAKMIGRKVIKAIRWIS